MVNVSMYVNSFDSISESTMDYRLDVYLRLTWRDRRLEFPLETDDMERVELNSRSVPRIWKPDLYFTNEKSGSVHDVIDRNELVHIYRNGTVLYCSRISLTLSCPMKLLRYPHDHQECPLKLSIFGFTDDVVKFSWRSYDPITFNPDIHLTQFTYNHHPSVDECVIDFDIVGQFTCLSGVIRLEREFGYYFIQIYLPSILIVWLSWISFFLPPEAIPARVSIGLITVLTMTTHSSKARDTLPHVSYITAIDIWMSMSTTFVFLAMLEYAVVNMLSQKKSNKSEVIPERDSKLHSDNKMRRCGSPELKLDIISRVIFPLCYSVFQLYYWPYYLAMDS